MHRLIIETVSHICDSVIHLFDRTERGWRVAMIFWQLLPFSRAVVANVWVPSLSCLPLWWIMVRTVEVQRLLLILLALNGRSNLFRAFKPWFLKWTVILTNRLVHLSLVCPVSTVRGSSVLLLDLGLLHLSSDLLPDLLEFFIIVLQVELVLDDLSEKHMEIVPQIDSLSIVLTVDKLLDLTA